MSSEKLPSIIVKTELSNFRQNNWGDTNNEVIEKEGIDYRYNTDKILVYENKMITGLKCNISFSFKFSRLCYGSIDFNPDYNDLNEYVSLFYSLRESLIESLGYPSGNESVWINNRYKNNEKLVGYAIHVGDYSLNTGWMSEKNHIFLILDNTAEPVSLRLSAKLP